MRSGVATGWGVRALSFLANMKSFLITFISILQSLYLKDKDKWFYGALLLLRSYSERQD